MAVESGDPRPARIRWRVASAAAVAAAALLLGISGLMKALPNACVMTYMYPTYVPVPSGPGSPSGKYGLFLYHEGWKKIDFEQHLRRLAGVPVLFIPGNGGSYKQVRSLGAESDRAYNAGPQDKAYYQQSFFTPDEAGMSNVENLWGRESWDSPDHVRDLLADVGHQEEYVNRLDWFAVDLEGEHSALDGRILEEHTEYVVQAIHRILDQYRESLRARSGGKRGNEDALPTSVIVVGHSMGGFVARAAVVHPELRKGTVQTVVTISSPHLLPPLALQPSLGHFFSRINKAWRMGYSSPRSRSGRPRPSSEAPLSDVIVISLPGGIYDYQVRSRMASLDTIVPATNSLTVGAPEMLNAWLSTEHQTILWCNQLVVQLAHTLLNVVDRQTGQVISSPRTRLAVFIARLRSAIPQTFGWLATADLMDDKESASGRNDKSTAAKPKYVGRYACPRTFQWEGDRDFHVDTSLVTVLAMDGRRRWLDIQKQAVHGRSNFVLVTNFAPCLGIRVHLWHGKSKKANHNAVEVTAKMVQLPSAPAPRQAEPGGQSEQASPSGILRLSADDLEGFRYITISVAPRPTVVGRPPPAASMAVGQFIDPRDGSAFLSAWSILSSTYRSQSLHLNEKHPLVMNFSVSVGFGVLPLLMEVKTASCGISDRQQAGDSEVANLCKLRCFPPLAMLWDPYAGLQILPNLRVETIVSDSSTVLPGLKYGSQEASMVLLADPHCGYNITFKLAKSITVNRFLLTHASQIGGFMVAVLLYALSRQARAWELDTSFPSLYACLERNFMFPVPFLPLCFGPLFIYFFRTTIGGDIPPPYVQTSVVAAICYVIANGIMAVLAVGSMLTFHATASLQVFLRSRWQSKWNSRWLRRLFDQVSVCFNLQMVRKVRAVPRLTTGIVATVLVFFVHPVLGLSVLLLAHTWSCHLALCSYRETRATADRPQADANSRRNGHHNGGKDDLDESSVVDTKSVALVHLESFKFFQGLLLLHFTATAMLLPSFIAWTQRPKVDRTLPWFLDSLLCFGVLLHGLYASSGGADTISSFSRFEALRSYGLSVVFAVSGLYTYWAGLCLAPYRAFYAFAAIGLITSVMRYTDKNKGDCCSLYKSKRRHFHGH
ncbi:GPI inositol-deacylase [Selaginella moellendorffii]|uniref:GPI inositol-deacylase n=1 Tax=Selaginella moellendorffii TaxID=88036 RepID=UPI000D1C3510|nr:GPI inositol-deacylase [Selaginella moellendorffii]|eukprot:XP_024528955.1 GPI inositol-deacylase [Selaginella moellendorffii]